ncbi:MAG TPA: DMT family transporter [Hyphomicrobiaceae bacterium]|nr:DMT family transporter [Hyphomicrobiaceae bacterium]
MPFFRSQAAAYILLPLASLCWAGNHIVARLASGTVPPGGLAVARWIVVVAILAVTAVPHLRRDWPAIRRRLGPMLLLSITGGGVFGTLQFVALNYTTALNMGVVGSVAPAFIVIASYLLFGDRLNARQALGVAISLSGVLAIVSQLSLERLLTFSFNAGDLIIILNMMLWAIYSACLRLAPPVHIMSFLFAMALVAGLVNIPLAAYEYSIEYSLQPNLLTAGTILYAALFTTLLGYITWNRGVAIVGAPRASAFLNTIPIFAGILATTLLGEKLQPFHVVGFILIIAGVTLAARPAAASARPATAGAGSSPQPR